MKHFCKPWQTIFTRYTCYCTLEYIRRKSTKKSKTFVFNYYNATCDLEILLGIQSPFDTTLGHFETKHHNNKRDAILFISLASHGHLSKQTLHEVCIVCFNSFLRPICFYDKLTSFYVYLLSITNKIHILGPFSMVMSSFWVFKSRLQKKTIHNETPHFCWMVGSI